MVLDFLDLNVYFILLELKSFAMFFQTPESYRMWFAKQICLTALLFVLGKKNQYTICASSMLKEITESVCHLNVDKWPLKMVFIKLPHC